MRTPLIAGNWKMYKTVGEATLLVRELLAGLSELTDREAIVCPPFTALAAVAPLLTNTPLGLGAQNLYPEAQGAFTGEVSPPMLVDIGCRYVIVGHSERRQYFGESDSFVNRKLRAALAYGLRPIVCVGESKPQRDAGQAEPIVTAQVRAALVDVTPEQMLNVVMPMSRSGPLALAIPLLLPMLRLCMPRFERHCTSCTEQRSQQQYVFNMAAVSNRIISMN
jgi:triosephosphate isomerase (EC 5.3.1.1)